MHVRVSRMNGKNQNLFLTDVNSEFSASCVIVVYPYSVNIQGFVARGHSTMKFARYHFCGLVLHSSLSSILSFVTVDILTMRR